MEQFLVKMDIDVKKAPLGKISMTRINKARDVLKKIKTVGIYRCFQHIVSIFIH